MGVREPLLHGLLPSALPLAKRKARQEPGLVSLFASPVLAGRLLLCDAGVDSELRENKGAGRRVA